MIKKFYGWPEVAFGFYFLLYLLKVLLISRCCLLRVLSWTLWPLISFLLTHQLCTHFLAALEWESQELVRESSVHLCYLLVTPVRHRTACWVLFPVTLVIESPSPCKRNECELWKLLSRVHLFAIPWTVACRLLCPWDSPGKNIRVGCHAFPGDLPNPGMEPRCPALQADSLSYEPPGKQGKGMKSFLHYRGVVLCKCQVLKNVFFSSPVLPSTWLITVSYRPLQASLFRRIPNLNSEW